MQQSAVRRLRHIEEIQGYLVRLGDMTNETIYDEASTVEAKDGLVLVKGPDDVDVRLTPSAAEETSERLLDGAMKARGQRYFESDDR